MPNSDSPQEAHGDFFCSDSKLQMHCFLECSRSPAKCLLSAVEFMTSSCQTAVFFAQVPR